MAKTALVTGASEGIGRAFAEQLSKAGYQLTLVARNAARLEALVKGLGQGHRALPADLSESSGLDQVAEELKANRYNLLVNNAGLGAYGAFDKVPLEKQQLMIRLNCDAVVTLAHGFLQGAKSGDALINTSSTLAFNTFPFSSVYSATKAFVKSFSEALWFEQKDRGVYVMTLCPGVTKTQFHSSAGGTDANHPPERIAQTADQVVAEALHALARRKEPTVVTGGINKAMVFGGRLMSRKRSINMMGGFAVRP